MRLGFKIVVRIGLVRVKVKVRGLVKMVMVRGWVIQMAMKVLIKIGVRMRICTCKTED